MIQPRAGPTRVVILAATFALAMIAGGAFFLFRSNADSNSNRLRLGKNASAAGDIQVPILEAIELSGLNLETILEYRKAAVRQSPPLLAEEYVPYPPIFERIKPGAAWFSIEGFYFKGPSPESVRGPSAEGRILMNPFMLLAPEFLGLSIWGEGNLQWNRSLVTEKELNQPGFPFSPWRHDLVWNPAKRTAEVTFDVTDYLESVNRYAVRPLTVQDADFAVSGYNAADMGMRYLYLDLAASTNIANDKQPEIPVRINDQLIFAAGACGAPEGCNHRTYYSSYYDTVRITGLPATAVFKLWGFRADKPDRGGALQFKMHFK